MLKWYLCIYIFSLSILNVFRKSNCIWTIRNDSKKEKRKKRKKSEDSVLGSDFGLRVGTGTATQASTF